MTVSKLTSKFPTFTFTKLMMEEALMANGYYHVHVVDNWVKNDCVNPDWSGVDTLSAFKRLLRESNIL